MAKLLSVPVQTFLAYSLFLLSQAFPSREPETVLQRYHRLKQEVSDLVSEVEEMKGSKELGNVSTGDIISDVSCVFELEFQSQ